MRLLDTLGDEIRVVVACSTLVMESARVGAAVTSVWQHVLGERVGYWLAIDARVSRAECGTRPSILAHPTQDEHEEKRVY